MPTTNYYTPAAAQAVAWARKWVGRAAWSGHCLGLARSAWGASGMGGTATDAWNRTVANGTAVTDGSAPPIGAPVFFTGGAAGHVAIVSKYVNGQPWIITNDYPQRGTVGEVPLAQLEKAWGNLKYVGWSKSLNGKALTLAAAPAGSSGNNVSVDPTSGGSVSSTNSAGQQDVFDYIQGQFGLTDALLNLDKTDPRKGFTLREAFDQIRQQGITDPVRAANILAKTDWFKTHGVDVTKRLTEEATGSGTFKENLNAQMAQIKDTLSAAGLSLSSNELRQLARDSYIYGMNASQVMDAANKDKSLSFGGGGTIGAQLDALDSIAYQNGVKINPTDRNAWWRDLANGNKTQGDYEHLIRKNAADTYSVFKDQIMAGQNLSDLARPYTQVASQLLEVPDGQLDFLSDPLFKDGKAFTATDPKTGQPAVKPLWQFRQDVMKDSRWQYTDNAKTQAGDFAKSVLQRFGMVA